MRIIVPVKIANRIYSAVDKSGFKETKGALFAKKLSDEIFEIEEVFISPIKGTIVFSNLINNCSYRNFEKKYHKSHNCDYENHNYIGDWHSHPLFECVPSDYDKKEVTDELLNSNAIFLIQLIVKIHKKKLIGRCYFVDRNNTFAECELLIDNKK